MLEIGECTVPRVAFGAEQLGGYEWGAVDIDAIERALTLALDAGVTFIDTADCYGRGESERRIGVLLGSKRRGTFLATKFGVRFDQGGKVFYDNDPDYAERALESSLSRLDTDYVDLFQVHWPDGHTPLPKIFERLERIRDEGRIRWYGVTNVPLSTIDALTGHWPGFATFSAQFNLANRSDEAQIRSLCVDRGLIFLSWGSLAQGLLSGKYGRNSVFLEGDRRARQAYANFHGERLERNLALVDTVREVCFELAGASVAQVAIRFVLEAIPQSIAIVGVKNESQYCENMAASTIQFTTDVYAKLDRASAWARSGS